MQNGMLQDLEHELHDLCQPLTLLQCRLELGQMKGDPASLKEAVDGAIEETQRMFTAVARMRETLDSARGD